MTDLSATVAKLLLVGLSLVLMASAVSSLVAGQVQAAVLFGLLAAAVVVLFSTM